MSRGRVNRNKGLDYQSDSGVEMRVTRGCGASQPLSRSSIGSVINDGSVRKSTGDRRS